MHNQNKALLKNTLKYFNVLFNGSSGAHEYNIVYLKQKPNATLEYHKQYSILLKHCDKVKEEVDRLEKLDVL